MSYLALYRKLRPKTFSEVIGQEHIIRTLTNQIASGRITHAYLFCGTRGTGKTSTAKIFARAINCMADNAEKPCNKCEMCSTINDGTSMNVIEIDAASNNGVDNIRDIREEVKYPPTKGYYKVYIIDEVHMLSTGAFNALLKTLEEPPEHVVFILATTDPQKLPVTVLSRCQRFDFHRISNKDMVDVLKKYMAEENIKVEDKALEYIAHIADGAMRDALSILDQCISFYYGQSITLDKVLDIVGSVDTEVFYKMVESIAQNDTSKTMDIINELILKGRDVNQFVAELIVHLRNLLISGYVEVSSNALDLSEENIKKLKEQYLKLNNQYIMELIQMFSELQAQMKFSANPRILLEVCCIKACNPVNSTDDGAIDMRLRAIEKKVEQGVPTAQIAYSEKPKAEEKPVNIVPKAIPKDINEAIENWNSFVSNIKNPLTKNILNSEVMPAYLEDEMLSIVCDSIGHRLEVEKRLGEVLEGLKVFFEKDFKVKVMLRDDYNLRHKELYGREDQTLKKKSVEQSLGALNFDVEYE